MATAELVAREVVRNRDTDFGLLSVGQLEERPDSWVLATSIGGRIGLKCGSRYANLIAVSMERWTSKPPIDLTQWEEWDEVPLDIPADGGPFYVAGFELFDDTHLDVEGLGRARARVLVRGRGEVNGGDLHPTDEEWLVQVWPDPEELDALAGDPRVLIHQVNSPTDIEQILAGDKERDDSWSNLFLRQKWELFHLLRWAPDQILRATPRQISTRLGLGHEHVIGGLLGLMDDWYGVSDSDPLGLGPDDGFELRRGEGPFAKHRTKENG